MKSSQSWKSKIGFILAASGAAVGLGNIQRFPYVVANYGGGAFLLVYLLCVVLIGIPLILAEFSLGRYFRKNPYFIFKENLPSNKFFKVVSLFPILIPFFIFSYYLVISAWTFSFTTSTALGLGNSISDITSNPMISVLSTLFFLLLVSFIVSLGINRGIESLSKILMPLLFAFMLLLAFNSLLLENSFEGLKFFLQPDFNKIDGKLFIFAGGQAFFSLCVGEGVLMTYSSFVSKRENLFSSALSIAFFDTLVAFLSGIIIFPALFSFGFSLDQDSTLIYNIMPQIFSQLPYGWGLSICFFLILCFAAITTCIALMEVVVTYLCETYKFSRFISILIFMGFTLLFSLPISLSKGSSELFSHMRIESFNLVGLYEIMDFIWGNVAMLICGLLVAIICGWKINQKVKEEILLGSEVHPLWVDIWSLLISYLCPVLIFLILLFNFI